MAASAGGPLRRGQPRRWRWVRSCRWRTARRSALARSTWTAGGRFGPQGRRALWIHRRHFNLFVGCFFRDLDAVVASLARSGLVQTLPVDHKATIEDAALVFRAGLAEAHRADVRVPDRSQSRLAWYLSFTGGVGSAAWLASREPPRAGVDELVSQIEQTAGHLCGPSRQAPNPSFA